MSFELHHSAMRHFVVPFRQTLWSCLASLTFARLVTYANSTLTPAAQELIGDAERVLQTLSNPVPRFNLDLWSEQGGQNSLHMTYAEHNRWNDAANTLMRTPYFLAVVHIETALQYIRQPVNIQSAVSAHLESQQRNFYHLGADIYLSKAGPEAQQAYNFFANHRLYTASDANSAVLVWRKDNDRHADPELIIAAAFRSSAASNPLSWTPNPMLQLRALDSYNLVPGPLSERLYRFDEIQRYRVFVPRRRDA